MYVIVEGERGVRHAVHHSFDTKGLTLCGRWQGSYRVIGESATGEDVTCGNCRKNLS